MEVNVSKRKGDIIGIWVLGILLIIEIIRVFFTVCSERYDIDGNDLPTPYVKAVAYSLLLYPSVFFLAFGGLIYYLVSPITSKPSLRKRPVLVQIFGGIFGFLYLAMMLLFCVFSFLISGLDSEDIIIGWLFFILIGVPIDIVCYFLWRKR